MLLFGNVDISGHRLGRLELLVLPIVLRVFVVWLLFLLVNPLRLRHHVGAARVELPLTIALLLGARVILERRVDVVCRLDNVLQPPAHDGPLYRVVCRVDDELVTLGRVLRGGARAAQDFHNTVERLAPGGLRPDMPEPRLVPAEHNPYQITHLENAPGLFRDALVYTLPARGELALREGLCLFHVEGYRVYRRHLCDIVFRLVLFLAEAFHYF